AAASGVQGPAGTGRWQQSGTVLGPVFLSVRLPPHGFARYCQGVPVGGNSGIWAAREGMAVPGGGGRARELRPFFGFLSGSRANAERFPSLCCQASWQEVANTEHTSCHKGVRP